LATYPPPPQTAMQSGAARGPRASFGQRLVAAIIDGILIGVVGAIIELAIRNSLGTLIALVVGIGYYGWLEGSTSGQTVGKKMMGIRVYDLRQGGPIGTGRAVGRYFARIISTIPCLLGYFWMLWDGEKQTWHDKLVGSVVVPTSAYPVESWPN
jgi:uncharacterized RDD family membrane protein YckC